MIQALYAALDLRERHQLLTGPGTTLPRVTEEGRRLAETWQGMKAFEAPGAWARRLAADGIQPEEVPALLSATTADLARAADVPPAWMTRVCAKFDRWFDLDRDQVVWPASLRDCFSRDLHAFAAPFAYDAVQQVRALLHDLAAAHPGMGFEDGAFLDLVCAHLPESLEECLMRAMVQEMEIASAQPGLRGDTPEARFEDFVARLRTREGLAEVWSYYPVLVRALETHLDLWVAGRAHILTHLCADRDDLARVFGIAADDRLVRLQCGMGDVHRGRSVATLWFASGARLLYKPKPLAPDRHFQELITWVNSHGASPALQTTDLIDRGDYGWVAFLVHAPCTSEDQVKRFYQRQGANLALLHTIYGIDFHFQNVIAVGEHPMLIDYEALFHPYMPQDDSDNPQKVRVDLLDASVMRTGMLPLLNWEHRNGGADFSALCTTRQVWPSKSTRWANRRRDDMHQVQESVEIRGTHRPTLVDGEVQAAAYIGEVMRGFEAMYDLLLTHREALMADNGPIAAFCDDEVRVLIRPTAIYKLMLNDAFLPGNLTDALHRDRHFDRLWVGSDKQQFVERVIPAEQADLRRGDIPIFTCRPKHRALITGHRTELPGFFDEDGRRLVWSRLAGMGAEDLARQLWFIHASMHTSLMDVRVKGQMPAYSPEKGLPPAAPSALLDQARAIGDRLKAMAVPQNGGLIWPTLGANAFGSWTIDVVGADPYSGLSGLALFFGFLGEHTGDASYTRAAKGALKTLRLLEKHYRKTMDSAGFQGWGGVVYTLAHLAVLWDDEPLATWAQDVAAFTADVACGDGRFDLLSGCAGAVVGLSALYRVRPSRALAADLARCARHLTTQAQPHSGGLGWPSAAGDGKALTGLSHGAAGIALALAMAARDTGEEACEAVARQALAFERAHFDVAAGNWHDLRKEEGRASSAMVAWCHGAAGIALGRLHVNRLLSDGAVREEIEAALETTRAHGIGGNHCLCHGDLGNLEVLLEAGMQWQRPDLVHEARTWGAAICADMARNGPRTGVPLGMPIPNLFNGLAGIGYQLLRLADPEAVPSLLSLAAPVGAADRVPAQGGVS